MCKGGEGGVDADARETVVCGEAAGDCLSRFSVRFFRLEVSKQNGESVSQATVVLKRHPCRIGLKWASLPISPWASAFC